METSVKTGKSTTWEKVCYGFGGLGANFVWTFMSLYVTMYYTNSVGIAAAAAGTMMLVARLLDGVSDIFFSWVIQKSKFKRGKITPWFLISAPMLAVSLLASFNVPVALSGTGRMVYIYITYSFTAAVSYTIFNLAFSSILPLMSTDAQDRVKATSVYNFIVMTGVMGIQLITPILLAKFGGIAEHGAWSKLSIIYALICFIGVLLMGLCIKEKDMPDENEKKTETKMDYKETLKLILKSKYTWMLLIVFFVFYLYYGATSGMNSYYFMYVAGDSELIAFGKSGIFTVISQLVVFVFLTQLTEKIGRKRAVIIGLIIAIVGSILILVNPTNIAWVIFTGVLKSFGTSPIIAVIYIYVADITDDIAQKHDGYRPAEVVSMVSSVGTKLGTGIGSAVVGWALALFSLDTTTLEQAASTINGLIQYMVWVPVITLGIVALVLSRWDLGADAKRK